VLIEAMAAGTPVVASSLDGYRNVATDEVDALLCEPGDVEQLVVALTRVLGDAELADRLREAGFRRAGQFSMTTLAERYMAIYEEVAAEGGARRAGRNRPVSRWTTVRNRMMDAVSSR